MAMIAQMIPGEAGIPEGKSPISSVPILKAGTASGDFDLLFEGAEGSELAAPELNPVAPPAPKSVQIEAGFLAEAPPSDLGSQINQSTGRPIEVRTAEIEGASDAPVNSQKESRVPFVPSRSAPQFEERVEPRARPAPDGLLVASPAPRALEQELRAVNAKRGELSPLDDTEAADRPALGAPKAELDSTVQSTVGGLAANGKETQDPKAVSDVIPPEPRVARRIEFTDKSHIGGEVQTQIWSAPVEEMNASLKPNETHLTSGENDQPKRENRERPEVPRRSGRQEATQISLPSPQQETQEESRSSASQPDKGKTADIEVKIVPDKSEKSADPIKTSEAKVEKAPVSAHPISIGKPVDASNTKTPTDALRSMARLMGPQEDSTAKDTGALNHTRKRTAVAHNEDALRAKGDAAPLTSKETPQTVVHPSSTQILQKSGNPGEGVSGHVAINDFAKVRHDVTGHESISLNPEGDLKRTGVASGVVMDAVNPKPEGARPLVAQLTEAVRTASSGVIEVRLAPDELGRVKLSLTPSEAGLTVTVLAERTETMELIRRNIETFAQDLRQQGHQNLNFQFGGQGQSARHQRATENLDRVPPDLEVLTLSQVAAKPKTTTIDGRLDLKL